LIKNLRQLKGYTVTRIVRKFRTERKLYKSTHSDNSENSETNCYTNLYCAK